MLEARFGGVIAELARAIDRDDAYVWQLLNGTRNMGERIARHIEQALQLADGALDRPDVQLESMLGEPAPPDYSARGHVPVVGTAQLGDEGFYFEFQYPVGHGDGYVDWPTRDPNAYAVRSKGDSMRPRIKHGEFVVLEPNTQPVVGEEVLVRTKDGRVMVKILDFMREDVVQLSSVNEVHRPITLERSDIELMHYVCGIAKASRFYRS